MEISSIAIIAAVITILSTLIWITRRTIAVFKSTLARLEELEQSLELTQELEFKKDTLVVVADSNRTILVTAGTRIIVNNINSESLTVQGKVYHGLVKVITEVKCLKIINDK
jgi:uncharacterized membrane protein